MKVRDVIKALSALDPHQEVGELTVKNYQQFQVRFKDGEVTPPDYWELENTMRKTHERFKDQGATLWRREAFSVELESVPWVWSWNRVEE